MEVLPQTDHIAVVHGEGPQNLAAEILLDHKIDQGDEGGTRKSAVGSGLCADNGARATFGRSNFSRDLGHLL